VVQRQAPVTGTVGGYVTLRASSGIHSAESVPVMLDGWRKATTDSRGYFEFAAVPEGPHKVALDVDRLPAEFNPDGAVERALLVHPDQRARADLSVTPLMSVNGTVTDSKGNAGIDGVVVRITREKEYTTTDASGRFGFYNLPEGEYSVELDEKSLPESAQLNEKSRASFALRYGATPSDVHLEYQLVASAPKPVQRIQLRAGAKHVQETAPPILPGRRIILAEAKEVTVAPDKPSAQKRHGAATPARTAAR
jgi:hypothetical protein